MQNIKPDYEGGSIVNLMSSLAQGMDAVSPPYNSLQALPPEKVAEYQNVVLLVIDGLGLEYLTRKANSSFIANNIQQKLTSVFPSTTASAISTFATGLAPQQHAITGWFMYFQELSEVLAVLPFIPRNPKIKTSYDMKTMRSQIKFEPLMQKISREKTVISPQYIVDSQFNQIISTDAHRIGYDKLDECFDHIEAEIKSHHDKKYIYAYWPEFDANCHLYGNDSEEIESLFQKLDEKFEKLIQKLDKENYLLVLTADHGLIDTSEEKTIVLNDYPEIQSCLSQPLTGEPRVAYCYVKRGSEELFERLVNKCLSQYMKLIKSTTLQEQNLFGLGDTNPDFPNRIGNYVLLMKENYIIKDFLPDEKPFTQIGVHGGLSPEEMTVPLVVFQNC